MAALVGGVGRLMVRLAVVALVRGMGCLVVRLAVLLVCNEMALDWRGMRAGFGMQSDPARADLDMLGIRTGGTEGESGAHEHGREQ
ncbi:MULTISPECIES: hypothetical protein [Methylobacterium]|nr:MULTISPECIES: hypothetical protein [Methylobacterium]TGD95176.1 hypothetical protein EU555_29095 [Methylobacterium nonmethylotrophicum]